MATAFESRRRELCRNLRHEWRKVTEPDRVEGLGWYPLAQGIVRQWSKHYGYPVDTVAAIVAAISPQLEWTRNLVIADDVLAHRPPSIGGVLRLNLAKALRLRDSDSTADLAARMREQFPTGPKVLNFALNLVGNMDAVTVDTHAFQCALGDPLSTITVRPTTYAIVADCFRTVADEMAVSPAAFQAILWHSWRRQYPRIWKIQNRAQWSAIGEF